MKKTDKTLHEIETKQKMGMSQGIDIERYIKKDQSSRIFYYEWEDGTISVGVAKSKMDAAIILDEIGEADPERVRFKKLYSHHFTFKRVPLKEEDWERDGDEEYKYDIELKNESGDLSYFLWEWANMLDKFNNKKTKFFYEDNKEKGKP